MESCLIEELKKLKDSSKEAVENVEQFGDFKEYMHVVRRVQEELVSIITSAEGMSSKQLILVCGSVGDGKSHLMSYAKNKMKILDSFYVHNDATESLTPDMTSIETLDEILKGFRDENLEDGRQEKVVVAINLGMLNNFMDEPEGKKYSRLRTYVETCGILESYTNEYTFNPESPFQHINFSDYHLYHLAKEGDHIDSDYIKELIKKLTQQVAENCFYSCYKEQCSVCKIAGECPVKQNYEILRHEQVQDALIDLLVEALMKHKIIVSTRTLLSFFYDILVGKQFKKEQFIGMNYEERMQVYLEALLPNLLYGHSDTSEVLEKINQEDPMAVRSESVDEMIIKFNILDDVLSLMKDCLHDNVYLKCMETLEMNRRCKENRHMKPLLLKAFIRAYRLLGIEDKLAIHDPIYEAYINNLYYFNTGHIPQLQEMYANLIDAIYKWNGDSANKRVNVEVGQNQFEYKVSQTLKIEEAVDPNQKVNNAEVIEKFIPYITVGITDEQYTKIEYIDIDYALFKLIHDIKEGYRPNVKDKNKFISFVNVIERIYGYGDKRKEVIIERKNVEVAEKFMLKKTAFGFKFERIS